MTHAAAESIRRTIEEGSGTELAVAKLQTDPVVASPSTLRASTRQ
jgi:hypothetical protein